MVLRCFGRLRRDPQTQDIPIVMISGNLQATEQFYVQRFGADDFMKKPFGRGEVFARIQHLTQTGRLVVRARAPEEPQRPPSRSTATPSTTRFPILRCPIRRIRSAVAGAPGHKVSG